MTNNNKPTKKSDNIWTELIAKSKPFSSIYGQVIKVIAILSVFLLISFGTIFRTINQTYMENRIRQSGNNVCMFVEGALYQNMLENNEMALRKTLDIINRNPSIEDVNMYDAGYNLAYSSIPADSIRFHNPNCRECHSNIADLFPRTERSFRIINMDSECEMSQKGHSYRLLMINSPILNEPSCYTAACHAHDESEKVLGSLVIRIPLEELDSNLKKSFILAALTTLIFVGFLMYFTRRKIKMPLNEIITASEAVSRGDISKRLEIKSDQLNDMRMVSTAFNEMLDSLHAANEELKNWSQQLEYKVQKKSEELSEMQNELIHIERIASLGKLSSSVAHEINNPLSGVLTYTKLVYKHIRKLDFSEDEKTVLLNYLKVIEDETKRCGDIARGLLDFSRSDQHDFKTCSVNTIISDAFTLVDHQMKIANISFTKELKAESDVVSCSGNQIKQACVAILMNASEAVQEGGQIVIRTLNPDKDTVRIEVEDNGIGIAPADLQNIFEPFFTTKEKSRGIGLGLAIVHGIVQNHDGFVEAESEPGKGTTISIILPLAKNKRK